MSDLPKIDVTGSEHPIIDNATAFKWNKVKQFISSGTSRHRISIQSFLHRFVASYDGRAVPAANPAHPHATAAGATDQLPSTPEPRNRGPVGSRSSSLGAGWRWVVRVNRRIEESWLGDLLALICLAAIIYVFLVSGWVLS